MARGFSILCLFLAGICGAASAAPAGAHAAPILPNRLTGWVLADLDGDGHVDIVQSHRGRHDGASYVQEITFGFSGSAENALTVRTSLRAVRLQVRDLDGDSDADLVLESFGREPLAVLLNDGDGHFHQADLSGFSSQFADRNFPTIELASHRPFDAQFGECPSGGPADFQLTGTGPELTFGGIVASPHSAVFFNEHSGFNSRGPPAVL